MKGFLVSLLAVTGLLFSVNAHASAVGGKRYEKTIYISAAVSTPTKSAANSGRDYGSAKGFYDGDLMSIPANVIIEDIYVIVDEAVVGPSLFELGDDDDANDFLASSSPLSAPENLGVTGLHYHNLDYKGAYLKCGTIVANSACAKLYSASGKELKLNVTGTASAGKMRVIVVGYSPGASE